jgi:signal transduction histidine kinase
MYIIAFVILISLAIFLAGLVFFHNRREAENRFLTLVILTVALWSVSVCATGYWQSVELALLQTRISFFISSFLPYLLLRFVYIFPKEVSSRLKSSHEVLLLLPPVFFALISLFTDHVVGGITVEYNDLINSNLTTVTDWGMAVYFFLLYALIYVGLVLFLFSRKIKQVTEDVRLRLWYFFIGVSLSTVLILVSNLVIPLLNRYPYVPNFGPFAFSFFLVFTAYAIIKHQLFQIRVITSALLVLALWMIVFVRTLASFSPTDLIFNTLLLSSITLAGVLLVRSVQREVIQREKIQEINRGLENLLHLLNHEIKGRFFVSKNIATSILDGSLGPVPDKMREFVERGLRSDSEGLKTVENILRSADIKHGRVRYEMGVFDLKEVASEAISDMRYQAEEKGLLIEELADDDGQYGVYGDREYIKHAILNLLRNAVIYTDVGKICVRLTARDGRVVTSVVDTGIGLSADDCERLFTEGGKGRDSTRQNEHSTGYGLFIVKSIVEAHKGKVSARSDGPGQGSVFSFELPQSMKAQSEGEKSIPKAESVAV